MNVEGIYEALVQLSYDDVILKKQEEERIITNIIKSKFGVDCNDTESVKKLVKNKRLVINYDIDGNLLGLSSNNRWLYTIDGRVIGKEGRRFRIEDIKKK